MGNAQPSAEEREALTEPVEGAVHRYRWMLPVHPPSPVASDVLRSVVRERLKHLPADLVRCIHLDLPKNHPSRRNFRRQGPVVAYQDSIAVCMDFTGGNFSASEMLVMTSFGFYYHSWQAIVDRDCFFASWAEFLHAPFSIWTDPQQAAPPALQIGPRRCSAERFQDSNFLEFLMAVLESIIAISKRELLRQPPALLKPTIAEVITRSTRSLKHHSFWTYPAIPRHAMVSTRELLMPFTSQEPLVILDHDEGVESIMNLGRTVVTESFVIFTFVSKKITLREFSSKAITLRRDPLSLHFIGGETVPVMSTPVPESIVAEWLGALQSALEAYFENDRQRDEKDAPSL